MTVPAPLELDVYTPPKSLVRKPKRLMSLCRIWLLGVSVFAQEDALTSAVIHCVF